MLLVANLAIKNDAKNILKMIETLALGYSSESTQRELFNEYRHEQGLDGFQTCLLSCALDESGLRMGRIKDASDVIY